MRSRPASLLVVASILALGLAPPAQAKRQYLRFKVLSVTGQQTATWNNTLLSGCGPIRRSGSQRISFESTQPARLSLLRIPRSRDRVTYVGVNFVRANWTLTRTFQQVFPSACPEPSGASDCGTRGPFPVPVNVGWRGGAVTLRAATNRIAQPYRNCDYDGFHQFDLIDSKGRLSQRRLTSRRRRTISVRVSARLNEPGAESEGSQSTELVATVRLRRVR